jgi:CRISPR/Cas system-associated exonuclease Cas4 (RecB family)
MSDEGLREVDGSLRVYLHISDAKMFRDCRRRWKFGSPRQLNLTPVLPDMKFWLGTGVHLGLQHYYQDLYRQNIQYVPEVADKALKAYDDWATRRIKHAHQKMIDMPPEQSEKMIDTAALGRGMLQHYFEWCPTVDNFKVVLVEHVFELPLKIDGKILKITLLDGRKAEVWMKGKIDAVVDTPDGHRWIVEHKTMASLSTEYYSLYDEQSGVYTYAAQETLSGLLGDSKQIDGVMYNLLRKKLPTVPEELKTGGLTKRKNISTTYDVYMKEIIRLGEDPADYVEILGILKEKKNRFFQREPVFRSQAEIHDIILRMFYIVQDMYNNPIVYPNPDFFKCRMCSFQTVCVAMSNNADWKWILDNKYEHRIEEEDVMEVIDDTSSLLEE